MLMGTTRKRKRRKPHPSAAKRLPPSPPGEGVGERKVFDVWYTPTIRDVYAQLKVAEQMLSRIPDQELAVVKREMYLLEDMMYQFVGGVTGMKVKGWMDQVDIAWVKAVEKKLGSEVDMKEKNDIRLLARLATGTNGRTALVKE